MQLQNRFETTCVIIDLEDDSFGYPKTMVLKSHALKLIEDGHHHLVLNLGRVKTLDSFGIAVIISILKTCKERKGNLTLYGLNDQVMRLMELTHMDRVLDIWETEMQAVRQVTAAQ